MVTVVANESIGFFNDRPKLVNFINGNSGIFVGLAIVDGSYRDIESSRVA